jgi:Peptidase family M48
MRLPLTALAILVLAFALNADAGAARGPAILDAAVVQETVDDLRIALSIPNEVSVQFVEANPLLVSVEVQKERQHAFVLLVERRFLDQLEEEDLRAVLAHELGHVWIYTHHPFLQTERGANDIAMRVVRRDSLLKVYEKVWQATGIKGDLARFLGP